MRGRSVVLCLVSSAVLLSASQPLQAVPLQRLAACQFSYTYSEATKELTAAAKQTTSLCAGKTVKVVAGDVVRISVAPMSDAARTTTIVGHCSWEDEEEVIFGITRTVTVHGDQVRSLTNGVAVEAFFDGKTQGAVTPGAHKLFVVPKDGSLAVANIGVAAQIEAAEKAARWDNDKHPCHGRKTGEADAPTYWFKSNGPSVNVEVCRATTGVSGQVCPFP